MEKFGTTGTRSRRVPAFVERPLAAVRRRLTRPKNIDEDVRVGVQVADDSVTVAVYAQSSQTLTVCVKRRCMREQAADVLAHIVSEHDLKGLPAYLTLSRADYETQYVDLPGVLADELREALRWRVTPPGVLRAEDIAVAGLPLVSDRTESTETRPLIRAAVMAQSALNRLTEMVIGAGLRLQAVSPRETALMNVAHALDSADANDAESDAHRPPMMTIFLGSRTCGILVTRGHRLYLSRTVDMGTDDEGALEVNDFERLVTEILRTSENFNKRLSRTPLGRCLIVPYREDAEVFDERLRTTLGIDCETVALSDWLTVSDHTEAADTATGILAVGGVVEPNLQREASLYQPPAPPKLMTAPKALAAWVLIGLVTLMGISVLQSALISRAEQELAEETTARNELQSEVAQLSEEAEETENVEPSEALVEELEALESQREFYATILDEFRGVDTSLNRGFSDALTALARTPVEGLWLQQISIAPDSVRLRGRTLSGFQTETLVDAIRSQPIFEDWNPSVIDVGSPEPIAGGLIARAFAIEGGGLGERIEQPRQRSDDSGDEALGIQGLLRELRGNP